MVPVLTMSYHLLPQKLLVHLWRVYLYLTKKLNLAQRHRLVQAGETDAVSLCIELAKV